MKKILSGILTAAIFLSPVTSFAADNRMLTYQEVFNKVLIAQDEIGIYNELIADLKKDVKNQSPLADEKNYEYIDGQEIETNATDFDFIDYKKILEDKEYALKSIKRNLELSTLDYYMKLINDKDTIEEKKKELELDKKDLEVAQKKYDVGMLLKYDLDFAKKSYENKANELLNLENDRKLTKQRLNNLMGTEISTEFEVTLDGLMSDIELDGKMVKLPSDALDFAIKNKKSLIDLEKDVKDYKKDLDRYEQFYYQGSTYYKDKEKELEELIKDTDDAKLQQQYLFEKTYLNVLDDINSMNTFDLQIKQKTEEISNTKVLYENGQISFIEYNKKANEISELRNSKNKKILDIKKAILDYNMSLED